ncbi:MAG: porin [Planctomycetota bacterium]
MTDHRPRDRNGFSFADDAGPGVRASHEFNLVDDGARPQSANTAARIPSDERRRGPADRTLRQAQAIDTTVDDAVTDATPPSGNPAAPLGAREMSSQDMGSSPDMGNEMDYSFGNDMGYGLQDGFGADCGCGGAGGPGCGCGPNCGCGPVCCGGPNCCGGMGCGCGTACGCEGKVGFFVDFWLAQGVTGNTANPANGFNLPVTFNDQANDYQMNQLYLSFGRAVAATPDAWDLGGRVDLLYGTDYFFTEAAGLETRIDGTPKWNSNNGDRPTGAAFYGLAMPQVYAEIYAPVMGGVNLKLGHFYTILGYERVQAPANFFYSHSYAMQYGLPFTHTGVLATFAFGPNMEGYFGWTRGWDNWEDLNGKPGFLGGVKLCSNNCSSLSFTLHTGREDPAGLNDRTVYSLVYTRRVNPRLTYVATHDFGVQTNAAINAAGQAESAKWYGLNQYFYYDMSDSMALGMRVEWFRDQDNFRVLGIPDQRQVSGGNYAAVTLGANWKPSRRLLVRPELRVDVSDVTPPGGGGMFDDFNADQQFTYATDVIFRF